MAGLLTHRALQRQLCSPCDDWFADRVGELAGVVEQAARFIDRDDADEVVAAMVGGDGAVAAGVAFGEGDSVGEAGHPDRLDLDVVLFGPESWDRRERHGA